MIEGKELEKDNVDAIKTGINLLREKKKYSERKFLKMKTDKKKLTDAERCQVEIMP